MKIGSHRSKIYILRAYYPKSHSQTALVRYRELSSRLSELGADVTILTTSFDHTRLKFDRSGDYLDGEVKIRAFSVGSYTKNISIKRVFFEFLFAIRCLTFMMREKPDLVLVGEPVFFLGTLVGLYGKIYRLPVVADIVDLWPEAYEAARHSSSTLKLIFRLLKMSRNFRIKFLFSQTYYCSESYKKCIEPSAVSDDLSRSKVFYWCSRLSVPRDFKNKSEIGIVYFGSLGEGYDIEGFISSAKIIKAESPNIRFYIAGDGPKRKVCVEADREGVITFLGYIDGGATGDLLSKCSIGVLPYRADSAVAMPIKLFDYLRAGLYTVSSLQLEAKRILEVYNCGLTYQPDTTATALTQALRQAILVVSPLSRDSYYWQEKSRFVTAMFDADEEYRRFSREIYRWVD
jgi:glycosyltransferase involved in cell wall biosynthesis